MVQNIYPRVVIWVRKMWENQKKKLTAVPSIYKEVHDQFNWMHQFLSLLGLQSSQNSARIQ